MISGSVRGAAKSVTIVADTACPTVGSAPADLMMSRAAPLAPLTYRTNTRLQPFPLFIDHLTEESIPDCSTPLLHRIPNGPMKARIGATNTPSAEYLYGFGVVYSIVVGW